MTTDGASPATACACVQLPEIQLKVFSEELKLVEPGAYTCELSVSRIAAEHEPPDESEHVVVY